MPPKWNRLTIFDARLPHGVRRVEGTRDPREARCVLVWETLAGCHALPLSPLAIYAVWPAARPRCACYVYVQPQVAAAAAAKVEATV